jgi:glycosyltransferase involved in cell wall biosynthesis
VARILFAGTYDAAFNRNLRLQALLERAGHEVVPCNVPLWGSTRFDIMGERMISVLFKGAVAYPRLIWRFVRAPRVDAVFAMYPGWFDVLVLAPLARLRGLPLVFDPFISLYDTAVVDRKVVSRSSMLARISRSVDRLSMRMATLVIADTPQHADFYSDLTGVPANRVAVLWLGAQDHLFAPRPEIRPVPNRVLFYGTFIPLQGVDTILKAAQLLELDDVSVRIVGGGQEQRAVEKLLSELRLTNVELVGSLPVDRLAEEIASATICLGIFGTSDKAGRVVPNKVFECAAVGRPIVTAGSEAVRGAFPTDSLAFVPPGNPEALASMIRELLREPDRCARMARSAHEHYVATYSADPLSTLLDKIVRRVVDPTGARDSGSPMMAESPKVSSAS